MLIKSKFKADDKVRLKKYWERFLFFNHSETHYTKNRNQNGIESSYGGTYLSSFLYPNKTFKVLRNDFFRHCDASLVLERQDTKVGLFSEIFFEKAE